MIVKIYQTDVDGDAWPTGSAVISDESMLNIAQYLEAIESDATEGLFVSVTEVADSDRMAQALREAHGKVHGRP